jgi:hypothetical protein
MGWRNTPGDEDGTPTFEGSTQCSQDYKGGLLTKKSKIFRRTWTRPSFLRNKFHLQNLLNKHYLLDKIYKPIKMELNKFPLMEKLLDKQFRRAS